MARILVTDDSFTSRSILKRILTNAGHTIVGEAADGFAAFEEYKKNMPDLVTMDMKMPKLSGIDAIEKILDVYPDARIIVISIEDDKMQVFNALQKGAKHYIFKPFSKENILPLVDSVLNLIQ